MSRGLVLGKFMPPHAGHLFLVDFARRMVDELTVVVGTLAAEPIPGALRHLWMRELSPGCEVLHLCDENPQDPNEHADFWGIWRRSLLRMLPQRPNFVFASEPYGSRLAAELGARFVPVDLDRQALSISGTAVRRDPWAHWCYLPACVRAHYVRRVSIFGPESTGKSTLAAQLARRYGTVAVPEYARTWINSQDSICRSEHMELIARGQGAAEDALARVADRLLICDTDPLATALWSDALFGRVPAALREASAGRHYALTLLLDVDVPFVEDPIRYLPGRRVEFFERCAAGLRDAGRPAMVLRGDWSERWSRACAAIDALIVADGRLPPAPGPLPASIS